VLELARCVSRLCRRWDGMQYLGGGVGVPMLMLGASTDYPPFVVILSH